MIKPPVSKGEPDHESEAGYEPLKACRSRNPLPDSQTVQTGAPCSARNVGHHRDPHLTHTAEGHIANQLYALLTTCAPEGTRTPNLLIRTLARPIPHVYALTQRAVLQAPVRAEGSEYRLVHGLSMITQLPDPPPRTPDAGQRAGTVRQVQNGARHPSTIRAPQRSTTAVAGRSPGPRPAPARARRTRRPRGWNQALTAGPSKLLDRRRRVPKIVGCPVDLPCRRGLAAVDITIVFEGPV